MKEEEVEEEGEDEEDLSFKRLRFLTDISYKVLNLILTTTAFHFA